MIRISTLNYNTDTLSDALYDVSTTQWNTIASLSNKLTLSISLKDNLFVGGTASIVSLNVNAGQIKNDTVNGRVGINVGTANPSVPFEVVGGPARFRTISGNAYMDVSPNVNNDGLGTMLRFMTSPGGTLMDSTRIYFQNGNPTQAYSGDIYTRCAQYTTDIYTTQSNNDASILGLQGFTGAKPIQYFNFINTVDTTRISANGFGMYVPYLSLSNLSHQVYPNVMAIGYSNGGTDPDVPFTLHCGSGSGTGDSYGGGLQVTNHNNYSQFTSRLPYDVAFRANGNATVTGSISANDFFVGGVSSVNILFTSFVSLSGYVSSNVVSLLSLSNYLSEHVVSFLSLSGYVSSTNASLMSLSNYVSNTVVSFLSLSGYTSTVNASLLSLSNYLSNTVVSFLSLSGYVSSVNASLMSLSNIVSARNVSFLSLSAYTSTVNASLMSLSNFVSTVDFDVMSLSNIVSVRNVSFLSLSGYVSSVNASLMSLSNIVSARNVSFLSLSGYVSSVNASLMSLSNFVSTVDFDVVSLTSFVSSFTTGLNVGAFVGINTNTKYEITNAFPIYHNIWVAGRSSGETFRVFASSLSFTVGGVSTGLETLDYFETGTLSTTYFVHMNFVVPPGWHFVVSSSNNVAFAVRRMI